MKTSSIPNQKLELFKFIEGLNNERIKSLHSYFIKSNTEDFWDLLADWQKEDIDSGLEDLKNNRSKPISSVLSKYL